MLAADKAALESQLQQQSLQIREKELRFFADNFTAVGHQAAMLAGFSLHGLFVIFDGERFRSLVTRTMYFTLASTGLGLLLLACANCTLVNVLGVNLALRGPQGSVDRAVKEMEAERRTTFGCFGAGLICFHLTAMLYAIHTLHVGIAVVVSLILTTFVYLFYSNTKRIWRRFQVDLDKIQTGQVVIGGYAVGEGQHTGHMGAQVNPIDIHRQMAELQNQLDSHQTRTQAESAGHELDAKPTAESPQRRSNSFASMFSGKQ